MRRSAGLGAFRSGRQHEEGKPFDRRSPYIVRSAQHYGRAPGYHPALPGMALNGPATFDVIQLAIEAARLGFDQFAIDETGLHGTGIKGDMVADQCKARLGSG